MQNFDLQFLIWLFCIFCNASVACLLILRGKFPTKFQSKLFSSLFLVLFFGILISITLFLNLLLYFTQDTSVLVFEIIEIIFLQAILLLFKKFIWRHDTNLILFMFSCLLFSIFRLSGIYYLYKPILFSIGVSEAYYSEIAVFTAFFYEFFFIICLSLSSIFILSIFSKIFSKTLPYYFIFTLIWACLFIFGVTPYIDLLLYNSGIKPYFLNPIPSFIAFNLPSIETYGTQILYSFITLAILLGGIFLGYKYGFKFMAGKAILLKGTFLGYKYGFSTILKRYIGIGIIIIVIAGVWYSLVALFDFSFFIVYLITVMFKFQFFHIALVHPFWLISIIYVILLVIPFYYGYLILVIIKKRENLWAYPNSFNKMPILNLSILVFSGFILCYHNLQYKVPLIPAFFEMWVQPSFVLFVIYSYLIAFLVLLTLYCLTFQKKPWTDFLYSLKLFLLYIPFLLGYYLAGQILNITDVFFGILSCTTLQIYVLYLRIIKIKPIDFKHLNWLVIFFWGVLSICFAGLLSITALICIFIDLILFFIINSQLKLTNSKLFFYGGIGTTLFIMGGTSSTFLTTVFAIGIPTIFILGISTFWIFATIFYYLLKKS